MKRLVAIALVAGAALCAQGFQQRPGDIDDTNGIKTEKELRAWASQLGASLKAFPYQNAKYYAAIFRYGSGIPRSAVRILRKSSHGFIRSMAYDNLGSVTVKQKGQWLQICGLGSKGPEDVAATYRMDGKAVGIEY